MKDIYQLMGNEKCCGERLVILLKVAQLQLNGTSETKLVPKYESSCFRKYIDFKFFRCNTDCAKNMSLFDANVCEKFNRR